MSRQSCPICGAGVAENPRYPRAVCDACATRAAAEDGRPLAFANLDMGGGFAATNADTGERNDGDLCYIDGIRCRAGEARFGGIVIEREDGA